MTSRLRNLLLLIALCNLVSCAAPQAHEGSPPQEVSSVQELLISNWELAELGDAAAQYMLAVAFNDGIMPHRDVSMALKWLRLSADQGDADAQIRLGLEYNHGSSVPKNNVMAYMWLILAERRCTIYAGGLRRALEKKLSQEQVEQAWNLARNWKEKSSGVRILEKIRGYRWACAKYDS